MPLSTGNKEFNILNRTRENEYFLFYVGMSGTEDIPAADKSSPEYIFTGSVNNNINSFSIFPSGIPVTESLYDSLNIYNSSVESYQIPTLPAKIINVRFSGSVIESTPSIGTSSIGFGDKILVFGGDEIWVLVTKFWFLVMEIWFTLQR